jgi:hypothetical protein
MANTAAFVIGYLLYTPIAHGVTGGHPLGLTSAQYVAHSVAMAVAAWIVVVAQRRALKGHVDLAWWRVPLVMITFNAAFWLGTRLPSFVDTDIFLGFTVLGTVGWLGAFPAGKGWPWVVAAVLAFAVANFCGQALAVMLGGALGMKGEDLQTSHFVHAFYFVTVALITGLLGGWGSGWFLGRVVTPSEVRLPRTRRATRASGTPS